MLQVQGFDTFPADALLVVVHPADLQRIRDRVIAIPGTQPSYDDVAKMIINDMIAKQPELREAFGWS